MMTAPEKDPASPTPMDLADLMRDFTSTAQEWTRAYGRMQSELARLAMELQEKNALLKSQERLAALGQMAAGVAHEIRNPLGGIQLYANLLQRSLAERPQDLAVVDKILAGVRHMERVVQQTLTFAGGMTPQKRRCELEPLVRTSIELSGIPSGTRTRFALAVPPGLACVLDPDLAAQMLTNLFVNACEAMGGAGCITVRAEKVPGLVRIAVEDTGPGVPEALKGRLFDPFVTSKANGVGLGLSIVWRIAEAHGGELALDAAYAAGARFVISLPDGEGGAA